MINLINTGRAFWLDEDGSTAIEYGLIAALVAIGIIASLSNFAGSSNSMWDRVTGTIRNAM